MTDPKNYELAYLLSPSVPEGEVLTWAGKLTTLITEAYGTMRRVEEPKRRKLAYTVEKKDEAYFGWTTFSMAPGNTADLKKKLKSEKELLRYLLTEEEIETRTPLLRPFIPRRAPLKPKTFLRPQEPKPEEKLDLEALDKKLEEILGK